MRHCTLHAAIVLVLFAVAAGEQGVKAVRDTLITQWIDQSEGVRSSSPGQYFWPGVGRMGAGFCSTMVGRTIVNALHRAALGSQARTPELSQAQRGSSSCFRPGLQASHLTSSLEAMSRSN